MATRTTLLNCVLYSCTNTPRRRTWTKKRRKRRQEGMQFICTGCCLLLVVGNFVPVSAFGDRPSRIPEGLVLPDCESLGFPNSTKNDCGFCVGGKTGLPEDHGKDCQKVCNGLARDDCSGVCGGPAYIDECTGKCIGGSTQKTESDLADPKRDCRGMCLSAGGSYHPDPCGVCRHGGGSSLFMDCTNKCHLPGQELVMARYVCERCVGGSTGIPLSEELDSCGNCKTSNLQCLCNGTGELDLCGVCDGGGNTCFKVVSFHPLAIPNNIMSEVSIKGAFRGSQTKLKCLFTLDEDANQVHSVEGKNLGTNANCEVKLTTGIYKVGVQLENEEDDAGEKEEVQEEKLLVYRNNVHYKDMDPKEAFYTDFSSSEYITLTFHGDNIPNHPLTCIVRGRDWPKGHRFVTSKTNTLHTCDLPYPSKSQLVRITPSLNGVHKMSKVFNFTFYAPPPGIGESFIAQDGNSVIVVFNTSVNMCGFTSCEDFLTPDTLQNLGTNATCTWVTKQQLVISLQEPYPGDSVKVSFLENKLLEDGQPFPMGRDSVMSTDVYRALSTSNAVLAIIGPNTVPRCGEFTLVGLYSSARGDGTFSWAAVRGDGKGLSPELTAILREADTSILTVDAKLLTSGVEYTFTLNAKPLEGGKLESKHKLTKEPYDGAIVTAYSSSVLSTTPLTVDQEINLYVEVSLPDCVEMIAPVFLVWSVDNPMVKFDFNNLYSPVLKLHPYTLPGGQTITFTATAYVDRQANKTKSSVTLKIEEEKLTAKIKGGPTRMIGNESGLLLLETEDPTNGRIPLVYQWRCHNQDRQPCYDYWEESKNALLVPRSKQRSPTLLIMSKRLKPGEELTFEVQLFNALDHNHASDVASTIVTVVDNSIPQVVLQSVSAQGIIIKEQQSTPGLYFVPAGAATVVHATVSSSIVKLKSVVWDIKGLSTSFTYSTVDGNTYLSLEEGFLMDHAVYAVKVSACDENKACGRVDLKLYAVPGVALCQLIVQPYTELEWAESSITGCSVPEHRHPLTYQLLLLSDDVWIPFTIPQISTKFKFIGPPPLLPGNFTMLSVQVCDALSLCRMFSSDVIAVLPSPNRTEAMQIVLEMADKALKARNPLFALSLFLVLSVDSPTPFTEEEIATIVTAATDAVVNNPLTPGQLSLLYSSMQPLMLDGNVKTKAKALSAIEKATIKAYNLKMRFHSSFMKMAYNIILDALPQDGGEQASLFHSVRKAQTALLAGASSVLPLGHRLYMKGEKPGHPTTLLFHKFIDLSTMSINTRGLFGQVEGTVSFGDKIREKFKTINCGRQNNCQGVVVSLTVFPEKSIYPEHNVIRRVAPVFEINLRKPGSGHLIRIRGVPDNIKMTLTYMNASTKEKGFAAKCHYWDETAKEWSPEEVKTMGVVGKVIQCWASHLTTFTVLEIKQGLTTATIVGIVVAALMGFFIFSMVLFFFIRKKHAREVRVSTEALRPTNRVDIQRVKRISP